MSRTGTIWAVNEGALQTYKQYHVEVVEWFVTIDDRLCEWCASMEGQKMRTGDPFFPAGDSFEIDTFNAAGEEVTRVLEFPFAIYHPPLHPYCRCVLVPVL